MSIPAELDARSDRALRGSPIAVYHYLLDRLSPVEWREVKQLALCTDVGYSALVARRALAVLVTHGYIEREPGVRPRMGTAHRYRLVHSRAEGRFHTHAKGA